MINGVSIMEKNKIKKITILGASSDIGLQVTQKFLSMGFKVNAHYYNQNKSLKNLYKNNSNNLNLFKFNLKNIISWEKYVKKSKFLKDTDALISFTGLIKAKSFEGFNIMDAYDHLNVNYFSSIILTKYILKHMIKNRFGRILYSSSIGTKFGGGEKSFNYSLSKFCNEFFPNRLRNLASLNILTNTIQIGVTKTKIHKKLPGKNLKKRVSLIPIKRMANIKEVGDIVINFILENKLISSQVINISGGE